MTTLHYFVGKDVLALQGTLTEEESDAVRSLALTAEKLSKVKISAYGTADTIRAIMRRAWHRDHGALLCAITDKEYQTIDQYMIADDYYAENIRAFQKMYPKIAMPRQVSKWLRQISLIFDFYALRFDSHEAMLIGFLEDRKPIIIARWAHAQAAPIAIEDMPIVSCFREQIRADGDGVFLGFIGSVIMLVLRGFILWGYDVTLEEPLETITMMAAMIVGFLLPAGIFKLRRLRLTNTFVSKHPHLAYAI